LPVIFDLFAQADTSMDRAIGGLGVGLSLAKSLTEAHGGTIRAESEGLDKGYHFSRPLREAEFLDWMAEQAGAERDRSALLRPL
jgi:signal transduction histidine kinase